MFVRVRIFVVLWVHYTMVLQSGLQSRLNIWLCCSLWHSIFVASLYLGHPSLGCMLKSWDDGPGALHTVLQLLSIICAICCHHLYLSRKWVGVLPSSSSPSLAPMIELPGRRWSDTYGHLIRSSYHSLYLWRDSCAHMTWTLHFVLLSYELVASSYLLFSEEK
jgi:hypothetical protein